MQLSCIMIYVDEQSLSFLVSYVVNSVYLAG